MDRKNESMPEERVRITAAMTKLPLSWLAASQSLTALTSWAAQELFEIHGRD